MPCYDLVLSYKAGIIPLASWVLVVESEDVGSRDAYTIRPNSTTLCEMIDGSVAKF
jgi:hypothetical protein